MNQPFPQLMWQRLQSQGFWSISSPATLQKLTMAPKVDTKTGKAIITKIDGEEVELEEVELEDVETLIKEVVDIIDSEEEKGAQPRVVDLADEATQGKEEDAFTLKASEEDDAPAQTVMTAGATADPVKDYLKQIGRVALLNAELEVELATRVEVGLFAEEKLQEEEWENPMMILDFANILQVLLLHQIQVIA